MGSSDSKFEALAEAVVANSRNEEGQKAMMQKAMMQKDKQAHKELQQMQKDALKRVDDANRKTEEAHKDSQKMQMEFMKQQSALQLASVQEAKGQREEESEKKAESLREQLRQTDQANRQEQERLQQMLRDHAAEAQSARDEMNQKVEEQQKAANEQIEGVRQENEEQTKELDQRHRQEREEMQREHEEKVADEKRLAEEASKEAEEANKLAEEHEKANPFRIITDIEVASHLEPYYEKDINIAVVGSRGMGKSSLMCEIIKPDGLQETPATGQTETTMFPTLYGMRASGPEVVGREMKMNLWDCPGFSKKFRMVNYIQQMGVRFCDVVIVMVYDVKEFDYTILKNLDVANPRVKYVVVRSKADNDAHDDAECAQIRSKVLGDLQVNGVANKENFKGFFLISSNKPYEYDMKGLIQTVIQEAYANRGQTCSQSLIDELDLAYPRMFCEPSEELEDTMDTLGFKLRRKKVTKIEFDTKMEKLKFDWDMENYGKLVEKYGRDKVDSHETTRGLKLHYQM